MSNTSYAMAYTTSQNTLPTGETYTASCYVKTSSIAKTDVNYTGIYGAGIELRIKNTSVTPNTTRFVQSEFLKGTSDVTLDNGWSRISATFTLASGETLEHVEFGVFNSNGTAYFDGVQLEKGAAMNQYNMVENSSFERNSGPGTTPARWTAQNMTTGSNGISNGNVSDGVASYKITGDPNLNKDIYQCVKVKAKEGEVFSVSAWAIASSIAIDPNTLLSNLFTLSVTVYFPTGSPQYKKFLFNPNVSTMQNLSKTFIVDDNNGATTQTSTYMYIHLTYHGNANTCYYDNVQLYKDVNQSYQYDENGNIISTKDAGSNESSILYNSSNQLIKQMNADGTGFENDYDKKNNLLQSVNESGTAYSIVNNSNGSPISTQIGRKLLAYYNFDGNVDDTSGNNRNGINHGGTYCTGKVGNAIHFDGVDDYADLGLFDVPDSFSVSLWAKPQRINAAGYFVAKHDASGANQLLLGYRLDGTIDVNINNSSTFVNKQTLGYQHIVASYQKIDTNVTKVRIYKDTQKILDTTINSAVVDTSTGKNWLVGMDWDTTSLGSDYLLGDIDELAFFDGALGTSEVKELYDLANKESLVAKYTFNSDSNGKIIDSSINGHDGTYSSGATFTSGKIGNALTLNGTTGYAQLEDFYIGQDLSVSMWVKPNNLNNGAYFAKNDSLGNNILVFGNYDGMHTVLRSGWYTAGSDWFGVFKHVVLTAKRINKTQSIVNVYLDKVLIYNKTIDGVLDDTTGKAWIMGAEWDGTILSDYLNGQIDEVSIYNYELDIAKITNLYLNTYPSSTNTAINVSDYKTINSGATYTADGNFISSLTDSSGNTTSYTMSTDNKGTLNSVTAPGETSLTDTDYTYNANTDALLTVTKPNGSQTITNSYTYENTSDRLSKITHNGFDYNFSYDTWGNTNQVKVGTQSLITNTYKPNNGLLDYMTYGNNHKIGYVYDQATDQVTDLKYDDVLKFKYTYDNSGNLCQKQDFINNQTIQYFYDFIKHPIRTINSNGFSSNYYYDSKNRMSSYINSFNGTNTKTEFVYGDVYVSNQKPGLMYGVKVDGTKEISYTYDSLSRLAKKEFNKISYNTDYEYESIALDNTTTTRLSSISNYKDGQAANKLSYTYDVKGNIKTIKENDELKITYYYDNLNQLIREDNLILNQTIGYFYDIGGNLTTKVEFAYTTGTWGYPTKVTPYSYGDTNWKDKLTSFDGKAITYDEIGNPLSIGSDWSFTWQNGRRLSSTTKNEITSSFKYDDSGIRTQKTVGNLITDYYLNGDRVEFETKKTVASPNTIIETVQYFYDDKGDLFKFNVTNTTYPTGMDFYYVRNGQNDIIGIVDTNENFVASYEYDSWGKLVKSYEYVYTYDDVLNKWNLTSTITDPDTGIAKINPYRYRGYRYDVETELYYLQSRYYDPVTSRYLNADAQFDEGAGILGFNLFLYCANNPVMFIDPTGYGLTYVFYYNNPGSGFKDQAMNSPYYNTNSKDVKLISVTSIADFQNAWNSMSGTIDNVYLYLHGGTGVLYFKGESMSMSQIKGLSSKNVKYRVYLFSCHGGDGSEGNNVAWAFAKLTGTSVYACTGSVSYSKIFGKYYARKAWDWGIIKTFYYQKQYIWWGNVVAKSAGGQW